MRNKIVAIGLLTQADLDRLGPTFEYAWPVSDTSSFDELLTAIDEAEKKAEERQSGAVSDTSV
jgi:hypothetical protein